MMIWKVLWNSCVGKRLRKGFPVLDCVPLSECVRGTESLLTTEYNVTY